jgi:hypothetical protein
MNSSRHCAYRSFTPEKAILSRFGDMGVDLVCINPSNTLNSLGTPYCPHPPHWLHVGVYDWDIVDCQFDEMIEANPRVSFLCMIDLNTPAWLVRYSTNSRDSDHEDSFTKLGRIAASEEWRKYTGEYLEAFLKHSEEKYGGRIAGYILFCGWTTEWQNQSKGEGSPSRNAAWRKWSLGKGYGDPVDIPSESQYNHAEHGLIRDPRIDALGIRYWDFNRWLIADTILYYAGRAQSVIGHRVAMGIYFGYMLYHGHRRLVSSGCLGFDKVFASPDLDFFISPAPYSDRQMGGANNFMSVVDSIKLHGKGFFREIDHFTYTADANPLAAYGVKFQFNNHRWPDKASSIAGLRREFAVDLIAGNSFWWFDMWGSWYEDEAILSAIGDMKQIWDRQIERERPRSASQIAVLADAESCLYLNQEDARIDDVLRTLCPTLGRIGAPFSLFSFADLEAIDFSPFKLVILPNLFVCGQGRLEALKRKLMRDRRTLLWIHLAGVISDNCYDEANVERLTGISFVPGKVEEKDFGSWRSVLHADLKPEGEFIRGVARSAGVHLYGDFGEPIYADGRLMASHSAKGGQRRFSLPRRCKSVNELFSGRTVADDCMEFADVLEAPGTVLYELEYY